MPRPGPPRRTGPSKNKVPNATRLRLRGRRSGGAGDRMCRRASLVPRRSPLFMELTRRNVLVYALLAGVWALVLAWQAEEHFRVKGPPRAALRNRAKDMAT